MEKVFNNTVSQPLLIRGIGECEVARQQELGQTNKQTKKYTDHLTSQWPVHIWQKNWLRCEHLNTHADCVRTQTWYMYIFKSHCFVDNTLMIRYWSSHIDLCYSREKRNPSGPNVPSVLHFSCSLHASPQPQTCGQDEARIGWITLERLPQQGAAMLGYTTTLHVWTLAT